jgi:murein DD-endopeptidase MepM/ murein hydrolase activator NlpD
MEYRYGADGERAVKYGSNGNQTGMGGVFNTVNLHVYHYAGNNPVKYIDPDGRTLNDDGTVTYDSKEHNTLDKMAKAAGWDDWKEALQGNNKGAIFRRGTQEVTTDEMKSWYDNDGNWNGKGDLTNITMSNKKPEFRWPTSGRISDTYRYRNNPVTGAREFHNAIDIANRENTDIHTAAFGIIDEVGYSGVFGNYVWIRHGSGIRTRYSHLNSYKYSSGIILHYRTLLGKMGSTGTVTGSHLDFQIYVNSKHRNPLDFLPRR